MPVTPSLPPGPLYVKNWDARGHVHGWRPAGTQDWLLLYTDTGSCLIRFAGGEFRTRSGDIILFRPGTPQDYGQHDPRGRWKHVWIHWVPRTEVLEWLSWPELSPGLMHLHLSADLRRNVLKELAFADVALHTQLPRGELLARNAVERALLFCARANPLLGDPHRDPRIQQAVNYLAKNLGQCEMLETTARRFGFSRSRFAAHFRRQVGLPPGQYIETQRLAQARHLLAYTNQTLGQIAEHVGFSSPFYLSLRFKKHYGQSPRTFRRRSRG